MMKNVIDKNLCSGCSACFSSCPNGSIKMVADEEGFLYPEIADTCIGCGKCETVCPQINATKGQTALPQKAYAAVSKNAKIWKRSASGGAFSEICAAWGDTATMFCGAAWNGRSVNHICVIGTERIAPLCKSKYVASDLKKSFWQLKEHLKTGNKALFCGTPCQVAGMRAYLGKDYDNLLLVDLICHGVGSQAVFDACIKATEKDYEKRIASYEFRSKQKVYDRDHITKIIFDQEKAPFYVTEDRYLQLFVAQDCLRMSCGENCIYRSTDRQGDITIGDFKGLTKVFPHLSGAKRNYSTIVINTKKGADLVCELSKRMEMLPCKIDDIKTHNPLFYRHTYFSEKRQAFFRDFTDNPEAAVHKWTVPAKAYEKSLKGKVFDILPQGIRRWLNER